MATRADVRDAFYDTLVSAAGGSHTVTYDDSSTSTVTVDTSDIALQYPGQQEASPTVVYNDDYRLLRYNGVGSGPDYVDRDSSGNVNYEAWREYIEAQFFVTIQAGNEVVKEPIYESVRTNFAKYRFEPWDESSLHEDVYGVEVVDSSSFDAGEADDPLRADQLEVRLKFYREYTLDTDTITQVNQKIDLDLDSNTSGFFYTTA